MKLDNKKVLMVAQYAAPYEGNFIASLRSLEDYLLKKYNVSVAYALPEEAASQKWFGNFEREKKVYLIPQPLTSIEKLKEIIGNFEPDIIHSHFDGYDIPILKASKILLDPIHFVWHLHDHFYYLKNPLKSMILFKGYLRHYGIPILKNKDKISMIYVDEHERRFLRPYLLWRGHIKKRISQMVSLQRNFYLTFQSQ